MSTPSLTKRMGVLGFSVSVSASSLVYPWRFAAGTNSPRQRR